MIRGTLDGVEVELHQAPYKMFTEARLRPPGTLEVSVVTKGLLARLGNVVGVGHDAIGDAAFDAVFRARASDAAALSRALTPGLRAALLAAVSERLHPSVDDRVVKLWHQAENGMMKSVAEIEQSLRAAARLAQIASTAFAEAAR